VGFIPQRSFFSKLRKSENEFTKILIGANLLYLNHTAFAFSTAVLSTTFWGSEILYIHGIAFAFFIGVV
jgi:hypothetical protein